MSSTDSTRTSAQQPVTGRCVPGAGGSRSRSWSRRGRVSARPPASTYGDAERSSRSCCRRCTGWDCESRYLLGVPLPAGA
ncbi:hypothetical protein ACRAWF_02465 [Streptomyces sp. L7]